ncbi:glycyl-radical enzyme activating protein [Sporomusaceae bacterium FL31]|nr:glycyl-radical enzyme activating protein [Sporomusaceae bacterium FL31]GCE33177.1 glycyl-radical enzyme activating protein [Sporomusaceae bacterium]
MITGTVFNIQKYSIHDGPGIRTTVFLKGCPLSCWWCHNPESLTARSEMVYLKNKCIGCGDCAQNCPHTAVTVLEQGLRRNETVCSWCETCINECPTGAIEKLGRSMTVAEVMKEIEKDKVFYEQSGGGVTFSGGEALLQLEFLAHVLDCCTARGIHTAVDTSGYAPWESLDRIVEQVDLFLYDLKHMEDEAHRQYTGVSNKPILENLAKLAAKTRNIWIRIPVVPGINDDEENIMKTGAFVASLNLRNVSLLPYHHIAADKYARLGKPYLLPNIQPPEDEKLAELSRKLTTLGLTVKIGG